MSKIRHIITLLIFLALLGGAYYVISNGTLFVGQKQRARDIQTNTETLKKEIIIPLNRLTNVNIDQNFFVSTEYNALDDKSVQLRTPDLQRTNPFSPVRR